MVRTSHGLSVTAELLVISIVIRLLSSWAMLRRRLSACLSVCHTRVMRQNYWP